MRALLEPLGQIRPGLLLLAGLALFVLGVLFRLVSEPAGAAFTAAAIAIWLAAVAIVAFDRTEGRPEHYRVAATALPGGIALAFALAAVVGAAQTVGIGTPFRGPNGPAVEQVAGASATPAASSALSSGSPADTASSATEAASASASDSASPSETPAESPTDTPMPTDSPTPPDSPTPEPTPSPTPPPAQVSGPITIAAVTVTSPVGPGDAASAAAQVNAGVTCSIRVPYVTGSRSGLRAQVVPDSGTVGWTWTVSSDAPRGLAAVTVFCRNSDSTAWQTTTFQIE